MNRIIFLISLLALSSSSFSIADTMRLPYSLLQCNSSFFKEMYAQRTTLNKAAPLGQDDHKHAWFLPAKKGSDDTIWFAQPIKIQQLTLSGYYQTYYDFEDMGTYYYWGFIIDESPEKVVAAMPEVRWQRIGDDYIVNPMIKNADDKTWKENPYAVSGIAPTKNTAEKLAMLSNHNGKSLLVCSGQGKITNSILLSLRPDLKEEK